MTKIETIRRPRNVIERLLDAIERVSAIRERMEDATERRHITRALDEAKTAAGDNDADRIMRSVKLLECIVAKGHDSQVDPPMSFRWPMFIEPLTLRGSGFIGLTLIEDGYRVKAQNVSVSSESGNYLVDQYEREGDIVHVKLPPAQERRLVSLA